MRFYLAISGSASLLKSTLEFISDNSALKPCGNDGVLIKQKWHFVNSLKRASALFFVGAYDGSIFEIRCIV